MHMATTLNIVNLNIDFESSDTVSFRFGRRSDHFTEVSLNVCFGIIVINTSLWKYLKKAKYVIFFIFYGIIANLV